MSVNRLGALAEAMAKAADAKGANKKTVSRVTRVATRRASAWVIKERESINLSYRTAQHLKKEGILS